MFPPALSTQYDRMGSEWFEVWGLVTPALSTKYDRMVGAVRIPMLFPSTVRSSARAKFPPAWSRFRV